MPLAYTPPSNSPRLSRLFMPQQLTRGSREGRPIAGAAASVIGGLGHPQLYQEVNEWNEESFTPM
jgi:hypothetical protein